MCRGCLGSNAGLENLHEGFEADNAFGEQFEGVRNCGEQFAGVGFAQDVAAEVHFVHGTGAGEEPR
jgi:hypothetical protein